MKGRKEKKRKEKKRKEKRGKLKERSTWVCILTAAENCWGENWEWMAVVFKSIFLRHFRTSSIESIPEEGFPTLNPILSTIASSLNFALSSWFRLFSSSLELCSFWISCFAISMIEFLSLCKRGSHRKGYQMIRFKKYTNLDPITRDFINQIPWSHGATENAEPSNSASDSLAWLALSSCACKTALDRILRNFWSRSNCLSTTPSSYCSCSSDYSLQPLRLLEWVGSCMAQKHCFLNGILEWVD